MTDTFYDPESTLLAARALYFERNNFRNGGYDETWVKMKAGPIPIWFPNTRARVRAVRFHDLHHVLTQYPTTWRGEAEIGAWEVSTGCARHYPAWILNLEAFAIGLLINPGGVREAFLRGRHSSNLYRCAFSEDLLSERVGDVRRRLHLDEAAAAPVTLRDNAAFVLWSVLSVATLLGTSLVVFLPLLLLAAAAFLYWR